MGAREWVRHVRHTALGYYGLWRFVFCDPTSNRNIALMYLLSHRDSSSREEFMRSLREEEGASRAIRGRAEVGISREELRDLPKDSLGRALLDWMRAQKVEPLLDQDAEAQSDYRYAARRVVFTHDIYHVLLDANAEFEGEAVVAGFTCSQIEGYAPAYVQVAAALLHSAIFDSRDLATIASGFVKGWTVGKACVPLFGVDWDQYLVLPLDAVRAELKLTEAGR